MSVGLRQFHETLRVFVVGKNYRVQNIQLSKIASCQLSRQSVYVGVPVGAALGRSKRPEPTSVREGPIGLITSPKIFSNIVADSL
jgi:hypothetical protein